MESQTVKHISECFIKPSHLPQDWKQIIHLTPSDLCLLSVHYIQKGLLFNKSPLLSIQAFLDRLKRSLSVTLAHFYPLAGRLATKKTQDPHSFVVYIDCINSPGAKFVHSKVNLSVSDILSPTYVPCIVEHFFDHYKAVNHDGHTLSLLTLQVTELTDGVFIGCSQNHCVADGTSYWQFVNTLSQVFQDEKLAHHGLTCTETNLDWEKLWRFLVDMITSLMGRGLCIRAGKAEEALMWICAYIHIP